MTTAKDWDAALDAWAIAERERLGGPPTPEEVLALRRGKLSPEEAERVHALLIYDPELTELLVEPIENPPLRFFARNAMQWTLSAAAALIIVALSTMLVYERRQAAQPRLVAAHHTFAPMHTRGEHPHTEIHATDRPIILTVLVIDATTPHRVEIVHDDRVLWSEREIRGTIAVDVPAGFLKPGDYTLRVYEGRRLVDAHLFRITQ